MIAVFVAEIAGRGVIALNAESLEAAEEILVDADIRFDLQQFRADGRAVWNGVDELRVRAPRPEELALWEHSFAAAIARSGADHDEAIQDIWICLLVPVSPAAVAGGGT